MSSNEYSASSSSSTDAASSPESIRDLEFMRLALGQAELALQAEEIPVGCVIVLDNKVIATGYNKTNITRNGTKYVISIYVYIYIVLSVSKSSWVYYFFKTYSLMIMIYSYYRHAEMVAIESLLLGEAVGGSESSSGGRHFDSSHFRRCSLYVTCEPCIMCAGESRQEFS